MKKTFFNQLFIAALGTVVAFLILSSHCSALTVGSAIVESMNLELSDKGAAFRKKLMLDYWTSINTKNEISLQDFRGGEDAASRATGEGKAVLVLHLLRRVVGEDAFLRITRIVSEESWDAQRSWDEIRKLSGKETGRDLAWFFDQWAARKGLADLRMENAVAKRNGSKYEVSFDLSQNGDVYTLDIPVLVTFLRGDNETHLVKIDTDKKHVSLLVDDEPAAVVVDPDYDIPRKLTDAETPPLLAKLLSDEKPLLVLPVSNAVTYAGLIDQWKRRGAEVRNGQNIAENDIKLSSLLVLGRNNPLISRIYGKADEGDDEANLKAHKNPWNPKAIIVTAEAKSSRAADDLFHILTESGGCSSLSVDSSGHIEQSTERSERGIRGSLRREPFAVDMTSLQSLSQTIEKAGDKRIVYIGEYHDRFSHHGVEFQIIKSLYRKNPKIAIGMEMFQRPFQGVLDDYIRGAIEERDFLKKSEYFSRWGFDYNLYKPILDYARAEKIPVVALNLRSEIVDKVGREGIDALTDDEKKDIPPQTDFSDIDYRDRLEKIFAEHEDNSDKNFDFFYQAQVLWDETMAMSIDEYLQKNMDRQMVVLAGQGHLVYRSGIPNRVARRNRYTYATIVNETDLNKEIADYVVLPQPLVGMTAPRLMVVLKEGDGKVVIADMPTDSVSRKAGLKVGDRFVSIDNAPISSVDDVRIALFYKKEGEFVAVKVLRTRFLFGQTETVFKIQLQ